ncbi:oligosaccharide flippase family protein [Winogradskyella sp. A3E31]|uniref:oligosaccharide flippase family protein n=1 Tax=Winogradskyella sp. A3E31 TaxID=3349637 RepID=UPI00398B12AC
MKTIKDGVYATLDVVFAPLLLVIATPIFISQVGIEKYGLWILINSILASFSIFNFGINETIIKFISDAKSKSNYKDQQKVFSSVLMFLLLLAATILTLYYLVCFLNKLYGFYEFTEIHKILPFAVPLFFIKQIEQALFALHKSYENFKLLAKHSFVSKFILYSTQILTVYIFAEVGMVFLVSTIFALIYLFAQVFMLKRKYGSIFLASSASFAQFKGMLGYSKWAWFSSTTLIFNAHIDKWIVSALLGLKFFAYYAIAVSVLNQLKTIFTASISWVFPKISGNQISDTHKARTHLNLTIFASLIGLFTSIFLEKIDFFFITWLGVETFDNSKTLLHTFLFLLPLWLMSAASFYYLLGLGLVKKKFYTDFIVLILRVSVTFIAILIFNFDTWPIIFVVPILLEVLAYVLTINSNVKLKMRYILLFVVFNLIILMLRFFNFL